MINIQNIPIPGRPGRSVIEKFLGAPPANTQEAELLPHFTPIFDLRGLDGVSPKKCTLCGQEIIPQVDPKMYLLSLGGWLHTRCYNTYATKEPR